MSRFDDEVARRTASTQRDYEAWAARERANGNHETADRLQRGSDSLGRIYGDGTRSGSAPKPKASGGGCGSALIIGLTTLGAAGAAALQAWSGGGFS